jgi:hypothetical protein
MWRSVSGSPSSEDALSARERSFGVTCRSEPRSSAEAEAAEAAGAAEGEEASASMTWLRLVQKLEHCQREEERCRNDRNANHSQQRDPARVHDPLVPLSHRSAARSAAACPPHTPSSRGVQNTKTMDKFEARRRPHPAGLIFARSHPAALRR